MKEKRFHLLHLMAAAALTFSLTVGGAALAAWLFIGPAGLTLLEGMGLMNTLFVGPYEKQKVVDAAMYGMVDGLDDRWSYYLNPEHYKLTTQQRQNAYVGHRRHRLLRGGGRPAGAGRRAGRPGR